MKKGISELSYKELLQEIDQNLNDIGCVEEVVWNISNGVETLDSSDKIRDYMRKFKAIHGFRNGYMQYLKDIEISIEELKDIKDLIPENRLDLNLINIEFDAAIDRLDKGVFNYYRYKNISKIVMEQFSDSYSVYCKIKGVSPVIIEEVRDELNKIFKDISNLDIIDIEGDEEYNFKVEIKAKIIELQKAELIINRVVDYMFVVIRKYQLHRDEMYYQFYNALAAQYNHLTEEKPYNLKNFIPFNWQQEAFNVWQQKENNYHGTFSVCTGAGKTYFALYSIQELIEKGYDLRVSIVVPTKAIMQQWYNILIERFHVKPDEIGRKGDGHKCLWNDKKFIIYISNTAQKQIATDTLALEEFGKVRGETFYHFYIMDECHHYATDNSLQMLDGLMQLGFKDNGIDYFAMGLSATPDRVDRKEENFYQVIGPVIFKYSILEALAHGIVSPFIIHNIDCRLTKEEMKELGKINKAYSLAEGGFAKQLLEHKGKLTSKIKEVKEYSNGSLLQVAYGLTGSNRKRLDTVYRKQNDLKQKYQNNWEEPFNKWLEGRKDDKLIYLANRVTTIYDKKVQFIQSANERTETCLEYCLKNKDRKVIVFCEYIESADKIYEELVERLEYQKVRRYYSLTKEQLEKSKFIKYEREKENRESLEAFVRGGVNIIVTVKSFNEGVDIPNADVAIVYQSKVSKRESIQRLGRIVRKNRGQDTSVNVKKPILYFLYAKKQKEQVFLKNYFESLDYISCTETVDERKAEEYKQGLNKISFYPDCEYKFSNYNYSATQRIENQES